MKFIAATSQLADGLRKVRGQLRNSIPILSNVFIEASGESLFLTTDNLEQRITVEIPARVEAGGKFTFPHSRLLSIIQSIASKDTQITLNGESAKIVSGSLKATIAGLPITDFPAAVSMEGAKTLSVDGLSQSLKKVAYAAGEDSKRPVVNAVYINSEVGKLAFAASDGNRINVFTTDIDADVAAIVPLKAIHSMIDLCGGQCELSYNGSALIVRGDGFTFYTKLMEGVFPSYRRFIPEPRETVITAPKASVLAAINAVSAMNNETPSIQITSGDAVVASQIHPMAGEVSMEIDGAKGPQAAIKCSINYLKEAIASLDGEVANIEIGGPIDPIVIREGKLEAVIMPMRIL